MRTVHHPGPLDRREGERFLDQHMLAHLEEPHRVGDVAGLERRDVDDVDFGIGGEVCV